MKNIPFSQVTVHDGFWKVKQDMVRDTTVRAVYRRFAETHRFDAFRCKWKEEGRYQAHIFWDSDVAKWIEGVAYLLTFRRDPELEAICDETIARIVENADEHGYFNSYFLTDRQDQRFQDRNCHELYCAGHLIEAAVAYRDATGKDAFLKAMCRYADYIEQVFKIEDSAAFTTPGHPELELALVKLYRATGEKRYLDLSKFFIDKHGNNPKDRELYVTANSNYNMDALPLREVSQPDGHCVRALYLLCGMIDVAMEYGDAALIDACKRCFDSIVQKRMYVTGSVGSTHIGEAFTVDYDLPNRTAYTETCAAIALALFASRMQTLEADGRYADTVERALFNGMLSGISMDGKSFFYENPLEIDPDFNDVNVSTTQKERLPITQRLEVFDCSCCPPNLVRLIPSVGGMAYGRSDDTVFVHQYLASTVRDGELELTVETRYPENGDITLRVRGAGRIALRIPGWCPAFRLDRPYTLEKGYAYVNLGGDTTLHLTLEMPITFLTANRRVHADAGRVAVTRGPVVYCLEGPDNPRDLHNIRLDPNGSWKPVPGPFLLPDLEGVGQMPVDDDRLYAPLGETRQVSVRLIPYYAFANRGTSEMEVWALHI